MNSIRWIRRIGLGIVMASGLWMVMAADKTVTGVIVDLFGDEVMVNTDMFDPNQQVKTDRNKVLRIEPSKTSPGLLTMLKEDEILDLVAYILSGGDRKNGMFKLRWRGIILYWAGIKENREKGKRNEKKYKYYIV